MKSCNDERPDGLERLGRGALGLIALILVSAASAIAQSAPASISTIPQPSGARPFFDASGNTYYLPGQPTAGAAQTQPGGGTCSIPDSHGFPIPAPCPDASVMKVDPSGNQTWGTLLGGPTADNGTALAIDTNGNVVLTGSTDGQFPTTPGAVIGSSTSARSSPPRSRRMAASFFIPLISPSPWPLLRSSPWMRPATPTSPVRHPRAMLSSSS